MVLGMSFASCICSSWVEQNVSVFHKRRHLQSPLFREEVADISPVASYGWSMLSPNARPHFHIDIRTFLYIYVLCLGLYRFP